MTSRPPLGVQQRPPQRKLSNPSLSQRPPAHQRALSQQYLPPSPIRKETTFHDLGPPDPADAAQQPRFPSQRRGGSRLKLELSHGTPDSVITQIAFSESPNAIESSKPATPSRSNAPPTEPSDLSDMSPGFSTQAPTLDVDAPLPMPQRRHRFTVDMPRREPASAAATTAKKDTRPKPYTVEIPAIAPRYNVLGKNEAAASVGSGSGAGSNLGPPPLVGHADFFPWSGGHPEDQWSESIIRHGHFDKASPAQDESKQAKSILSTALKHKSGLHVLSTIFTGVLGQRRHGGQITAPSTFKPPPRVTLTDTKREMWLKDLANPAISLRRLSRTIPHGIRGKVMLDQCLNKNVPTDRAVWLTKCVGANELRATKRKGPYLMGGEARWVREWTICVEQFIEGVAFAFDEEDWKAKVNYAIRLATHLYAEQLLDREHYMEWLVSSLENSHQGKLPMWILITQIYRNDLLRLRKYGRRLVTALISHNCVIQNHIDKDLFTPVFSKLSLLLNSLILSSPENFLSPSIWSKYRDSLRACLPAGDEARQASFMIINERNEQLVASANRSQPAARQSLVRMLDRTLQTPMPGDLPAQCWDISQDKAALAKALLEWCTSLYRPGLAKVYVASRILRHWSTLGVDATRSVLDFLDTDIFEEQGRKDALYHLACELVRSGIFSIPRYVQWLIARGGLSRPQDVLPDGPVGTRLFVELPTHALTGSQKNTRRGMLLRASFSVDDEARDVELATKHVMHTLGLPIDAADPILQRKPLTLGKLSKRIRISGRGLKAEIGYWLRRILRSNTKQKEKEGGSTMSPAMFSSIRAVLEATEDFSMGVDILKALTEQSNVDVLAAIADTVSRHLFVFAALDASKPLFDGLYKRLKAVVQDQGIGARPLLASLVGLSPRIPGQEALAAQLKMDLAVSDRRNPVDACSPVSDNMAARLHDDDGDLVEEIEKLLAGGTSLDPNTMDRLFQAVAQRLQSCWGKAGDKQRRYSALLTRLRMFDVQSFDGIMTKWLFYLRTISKRPSILRIFPLLVSVGCLSMATILATTAESPGAQGTGFARPSGPGASGPQVVQMTYRTRYMQEALQLFMTPIPQDDLLLPEECYRFCILQDQTHQDHPKELLSLIRLALAEYSYARAQNDTENLPMDDADTKDRLLSLIRLLVLKDAMGVARALAIKGPDSHICSWIDCITTRFLIPTADPQTRVTFDQVLELTNEFTLPFCQLKLSLSLANDQNSQEAAERQQSHLELFTNAMDKAIEAKNISWTGMLSSLSPEITHHLKSRAQSRFLDLIPSPANPLPTERPLEQTIQMAANLLSVVDAIIRGGSMVRQPQLVPAMVDKFTDLWEILATSGAEAKPPVLNHWLPFLLTFIMLHAQTFDASKPGNELRAKALIVCAGLIQELDALHGPSIDTRALSSRIFDLACHLVDNLAEDSRLICVRALKDSTSDARLRYIFSFSSGPTETLMLCHRDKPPSAAAAGGPPNRPNWPLGGGLMSVPAALWGLERPTPERLSVFNFRRWEILNEPTPNVGENDTALSLGLFEARKIR